MKKVILGALAFFICNLAFAFMPASGLWQFDAEATGAPGRGFTIDTQNEVVFFAYYGYKADGSSAFYVAAGPITNNVFNSDLLNVQGGTVMGNAYKPASIIPSPGKVILTFTSGTNGSITLPGESPKAISKADFGYGNTAAGLLGYWQISGYLPNGVGLMQGRSLFTATGASTSTGNGVITNAAQSFICEFQSSGSLAGMVVCGEVPSAVGSRAFAFKFSRDDGDGVGFTYVTSTTLGAPYEAHFRRTRTKSGKMTGLNEATTESLQVRDVGNAEGAAGDSAPTIALDPAKADALAAWGLEVTRLLK